MKDENETNSSATDDTPAGTDGTLYGTEFFNIERHDLITSTAMKWFTPTTAEKIQELLDPIDATFDDAGGWADRIKSVGTRPNDTETKAFFADARNKNHKPWHYVNLPLGSESYEEAAALGFTRPTDVLQMIRECVRVLDEDAVRFSKVNALRLLGHLVGDVHQPLHVGCGFVDESEDPPRLVRDPQEVAESGFESDSGGNSIAIPGAGKLHSYWDSGLNGLIDSIPENDDPSRDVPVPNALRTAALSKMESLVREDLKKRPLNVHADDPGPVVDWAESWADGALVAAAEAYKTFTIVERRKSPSGQVTYKVDWEGKAAYNQRCGPILQKQMSASARHLAEMLNAIFDPDVN